MSKTLTQELSSHLSLDEKKNIVLNMDRCLKVYNDSGYKITNFSPEQIINDGGVYKFSSTEYIGNILEEERKANIKNLVKLSIGIYMDYYFGLDDKFLEENFSQFSIFIPEDWINYYKFIVERGSNTYLTEFVNEKNKREVEKLKTLNSNGDISLVGYPFMLFLIGIIICFIALIIKYEY